MRKKNNDKIKLFQMDIKNKQIVEVKNTLSSQ